MATAKASAGSRSGGIMKAAAAEKRSKEEEMAAKWQSYQWWRNINVKHQRIMAAAMA